MERSRENCKEGRERGRRRGIRGEKDGIIITSEVKPIEVSESPPTSHNLLSESIVALVNSSFPSLRNN